MHFFQKLKYFRFRKGSTVREEEKKIQAKTNLHFLEHFISKGYAKQIYLHFEKFALSQLKKMLNW